MGIMTRRNALVGWLVLAIARRKARQKAAEVVPIEPPSRLLTRRRAAIVAAIALVVGVAVYVRKRAARPTPPPEPEPEQDSGAPAAA